MLTTRLWMGTFLIALVTGVVIFDHHFAPVFPCLWLFQTGLALIGTIELIDLLGPGRRPQLLTSFVGVVLLNTMNWVPHWLGFADPWASVFGCFVMLILVVFLWEMATFQESGRSMERMGLTLLIIFYLGVLPFFLAQLRWLDPLNVLKGNVAVAMAIFVPKSCDIGAYVVGRLLGKHRMTPVLSPKKTWEGAIGGLASAALFTIGIDQLGPAQVLRGNVFYEIAFGVSVGALGMLGDLAESLIKRDCRQKDASQVVPGFGGVLDVVDAVIFSAPLTFLWLKLLAHD
jgi:phosphatidate cytidylyltransferase